ncbi:basic proline-rich protein-like [Empidonax traillii]|uniref:basic proline-rich protein-like n=1 Tax=Empidonax traillii TaxID=164674 RepID=UPI000FFD200F|nr:basic proline-rich protein-like [Empidonax traillii]
MTQRITGLFISSAAATVTQEPTASSPSQNRALALPPLPVAQEDPLPSLPGAKPTDPGPSSPEIPAGYRGSRRGIPRLRPQPSRERDRAAPVPAPPEHRVPFSPFPARGSPGGPAPYLPRTRPGTRPSRSSAPAPQGPAAPPSRGTPNPAPPPGPALTGAAPGAEAEPGGGSGDRD